MKRGIDNYEKTAEMGRVQQGQTETLQETTQAKQGRQGVKAAEPMSAREMIRKHFERMDDIYWDNASTFTGAGFRCVVRCPSCQQLHDVGFNHRCQLTREETLVECTDYGVNFDKARGHSCQKQIAEKVAVSLWCYPEMWAEYRWEYLRFRAEKPPPRPETRSRPRPLSLNLDAAARLLSVYPGPNMVRLQNQIEDELAKQRQILREQGLSTFVGKHHSDFVAEMSKQPSFVDVHDDTGSLVAQFKDGQRLPGPFLKVTD